MTIESEGRRPLVLLGGGGHAKVVADVAASTGEYQVIGYLDRAAAASPPPGLAYLGPDSMLETLQREGVMHAFVAIGDNSLRMRLGRRLREQGFIVPTLVSRDARLATSTRLGSGTVAMPGALVNACTVVGNDVILNTGAILDHDCVIEDGAHIAPGSALAGNVHVGQGSFLGIGTRVIPGISIGAHATVGAGSVVIRDIAAHARVAGVPASPLSSSSSSVSKFRP